MAEDQRRVELVTETNSDGLRGQLTGAGLLVACVIGYPALNDAARGNGSFEMAIGRFLLCVIVCLVAASVLSSRLEAAGARDRTRPDEEEAQRMSKNHQATEDRS